MKQRLGEIARSAFIEASIVSDRWESAALTVARHVTEHLLASVEQRALKKSVDRPPQENDFDDNFKNHQLLTYYDVWIAAHVASEDPRKGLVEGECDQCRNPHYDGMCEEGCVNYNEDS